MENKKMPFLDVNKRRTLIDVLDALPNYEDSARALLDMEINITFLGTGMDFDNLTSVLEEPAQIASYLKLPVKCCDPNHPVPKEKAESYLVIDLYKRDIIDLLDHRAQTSLIPESIRRMAEISRADTKRKIILKTLNAKYNFGKYAVIAQSNIAPFEVCEIFEKEQDAKDKIISHTRTHHECGYRVRRIDEQLLKEYQECYNDGGQNRIFS